ncbi:MAG: amidase family protein [Phycisphaerales bacterium]|nr:amidase family protein [Phycisphaerales bacterium]
MDPGQSRRRFIALASAMSAVHLVPAGEHAHGAVQDPAEPPSTPPPSDAPATVSDAIDSRTIEQAERIAGIRFTPAEREMMVETIAQQPMMFQARREGIELPETLFPATVFDPLLPGRAPRPTTATGDPNRLPTVRSAPGGDSDIDFASIAQLGHWLRTGAVTSVELTERSLRRLRTHGKTLECVVNLLEDRALAQARRADAELASGRDRGPLHGIPWGAKDLFDASDAPTTWGAAPYRDRRSERDATVIHRLDDAGAVLVAKLTLGALAYGDIWFGGRTNNPWNLI